jgi:membrane protein DedA with SNARE-associated domain
MGLGTILEAVIVWAQSVVRTAGYLGLFFVMFLENICPPIPSEVILPLAGSLVSEGAFTLLGVTGVGAGGSVAGALIFYVLGHVLGEARVRRLVRSYGKWITVSEADLDKAFRWFNRYGEGVIFFGRMVPIVRSLVSIPAGLARMNLARFGLYTAIGTALWSLLLAGAGYLLGTRWHLVSEWVNRYEKAILALLVVGAVAFVVTRLVRRRSAARADRAAAKSIVEPD